MPLLSVSDELPKHLFINNAYVESKNTAKWKVHNPIDNSLVADDISVAGAEDVDLAVSYAEAAFPAWKKLTNVARRNILLKLADLILENAEPLLRLSRITLGRPVSVAWEPIFAAEILRYYAGWIDKVQGESMPADDGMRIIRHEPLGVTAGILPWNGPLTAAMVKAAGSLAAGNCFICKPSEKTPFAALALGKLIVEAGFPPGVFQILTGDGSTGALLSHHMKIKKISFTGSSPVGKRILAAAANSNLKRVTLELGGKSPAIVFDDCNFEMTIPATVKAILMNSGQGCVVASRVYVQEGIYDKFVAAYKAEMERLVSGFGDPNNSDTKYGPLVDQSQFDRVKGFVDRAQKGPGKLLTGGKRIGEKGFLFEPTVFVDVPDKAEIFTEEVFGPVSVIGRFKDEDEIIARANDSKFGLMAGVFTQDINKALRVASEIDSGMVGINCVSEGTFTAPFGGNKESGIGREMGFPGLMTWMETKTVMINLRY